MLLLRGLIPRKVRLEHYVGAAVFGMATSYYTFMPYLAEQARLRKLREDGSEAVPHAPTQHPGMAPRFGAQRAQEAPEGGEKRP